MTIRNKRIVVITFCLCALVAVVIEMVGLPSPKPSLSVLPSTSPFPTNQPTTAERLIPRRWTWAWSLHDYLFRAPKSFRIYIGNFGFPISPESFAAQFHLGAPMTETNGLKIWLLTPQNLLPLKEYAATFHGAPFIDDPKLQVAYGQVGQQWTVTYAMQMAGRLMDLQATLHLYTITQPQNEAFTTLQANLTEGSGILLLTNGLLTKGGGVILAGTAADANGHEVFY